MNEENNKGKSGANIIFFAAIAAVVLTLLVVGIAAGKKKDTVQPAQAAAPSSVSGASVSVPSTLSTGQTTIPTFTTEPLQTEPFTAQNSQAAEKPTERIRTTYLVTAGTVRKYTPPKKTTTTRIKTTKDPAKPTSKTTTRTTTTKKVDEWRLAYKSYLNSHYSQLINDYPDTDVYFAYIDGNNVPEMIITRGDSHYSGAQIISFYDGTLRDFGERGYYGDIFYVEKSGILIIADDTSSSLNETVYSFKNGRADRLWSGTYNSSGCYANGVSVSTSEFLAQRDQYFSVDDVTANGKICYSLTRDLIDNFEAITVF